MTDAEKMQKLQETLDNFLNNVAQRAETANSVNKMMGDAGSSDTQDEEFTDDWEDAQEDEADDWVDAQENEADGWFDTQEAQKGTTSSSQESYTSKSEDFSSDEEDEVTQEVKVAFNPDDWKKAWMDSMQATKAFYDSEKAKRKIEEERRSATQPKQCNDTVMYKKNTATFNGRPFEYKVLQKEANWGTAFTQSFSIDDKITNLDKLNEKLIEDIKLNFGDLSRITEVAVISGMLIINGVQYYPLCNDKAFLDGLPFDCADYFKSGLIAEIFDFGYLYYMPYLTSLKIDSMDFAVRKFAYDIGIKGTFRIPLVFKAFKNLKYFEIGDSFFEAPGRDVNAEVQEDIERHSRAAEIYDNFIIGNASSFRGWTFNNLKTYACNRGDKGFFRYSGGVIARGAMSLTAGVGELGLRGIGAVVKGGAHLLKKAFADDI